MASESSCSAGRGILAPIFALLTTLVALPAAQGAEFRVDSVADAPDMAPGDGECAALVIEGGGVVRRCTLRAALMEANRTPAADVIQLEARNYILSHVGIDEDAATAGDFDITAPVRITAPPYATINALYRDRVFDVHPGAHTTFENLSIQNGGNLSRSDGAGIRVLGASLTLRNVLVIGNVVGWNNGCGGGISFASRGSGNFVMEDSWVMLNSSGHQGGGVCVRGPARISRSRIGANRAASGYGGLRIDWGTAPTSTEPEIVAKIDRTVVYNNVAAYDAGVSISLHLFAGLVFHDSAIVANESTGVAEHPGRAIGGLYLDSRFADITNVTISRNVAADGSPSAAVILGAAPGGFPGININNLTITENVVKGQCHDDQSGDCVAVASNTGSKNPVLGIQNTIIAGNTGPAGFHDIRCASPIESRGYNIVGSEDRCRFGAGGLDRTGVADPELGPLDNSLGPTPAHAPLPGGMAVDAGNPLGCTLHRAIVPGPPDSPLTHDQEARPRPVGAACDIGAIELQTKD